jgi:hypothetical protein
MNSSDKRTLVPLTKHYLATIGVMTLGPRQSLAFSSTVNHCQANYAYSNFVEDVLLVTVSTYHSSRYRLLNPRTSYNRESIL